MKRKLVHLLFRIAFCALLCGTAFGQAKKPNIVVIWGDDIGMWNLGAYTHGMMGRTPNIDRIAKEGILFTDHYGQPSCTAGRAAFIMGEMPIRTGRTTVGIPGSARGIQNTDPTLAQVLKSVGYATAQFGKNHLGDRNEFLPTVHGFDEWFGNLYHLNAEEEPEELDYPGQKNPDYSKKFGPRGVLHTWATDTAAAAGLPNLKGTTCSRVTRWETQPTRSISMRDKCARVAQATWKPHAKRRDPVDLLIEPAADRMPQLLPFVPRRSPNEASA
jgi:arylsulfatase